MKINKTFFAAALVAVAFTSCETKENSHRETQPFSMLNYVTNGTEQAYSLGTSAISIEYIGTSASSLSVRNVVMTSGTASSFEVTGLNNKNVTNGMGFDLSSTSSATGMSEISIRRLGGTRRSLMDTAVESLLPLHCRQRQGVWYAYGFQLFQPYKSQ